MIMRALRVVVATIVAVSAVALLYVEVAVPIIDMGSGDGAFTGPFSVIVTRVETMVPLVIALLLLGIVIWMVVSTVQQERTVRRPPP